MVASDVIDPEDLKESWKDVGGLENVIEMLQVLLTYFFSPLK